MRQITSRDNQVLKDTIKLLTKKHRDREGLYLIEGYHLLGEALEGGAEIRRVFFRESLGGGAALGPEAEELAARLEQRHIPTFSLRSELFDLAADAETPQGVLAVAEKKESGAGWLKGAGNVLVIDRVQDPGNLGTLLRTAEGAGYAGVLLLKGSGDVYSPKVVRAASGSLLRLPLLLVDTPEAALEILREKGKRTVCTSPHCDVYYYDVNMQENIALIVGNEGEGVCRTFMEQADCLVKIPMQGAAESLNVAVAAGILMFESLRQAGAKR